MRAVENISAVLDPIASPLRAIIHRIRVLIVYRGLAAVAATAVAALLVVMGIDSLVLVRSIAARWMLTLGVMAPAGFVAIVTLAVPLMRAFTLRGMARLLEQRHPELQERISSAIELLNSHDAPSVRGSEALIAALARQAGDAAIAIRPRREASVRFLSACMLAAVVTLGAVVGLMVLWPAQTSQLIARALIPGADITNLAGGQLICTPGRDRTVWQGYRLLVTLEVIGKEPSEAEIWLTDADGKETAHQMQARGRGDKGNPLFSFNCEPAYEAFSYQLVAGRAVSRRFTVTPVASPKVKRIDLRYDYPGYTKREPETFQNASGAISALAGTRVTITVTADAPFDSATLLLDGKGAPSASTRPAADKEANSRSFFLDLVSENGLDEKKGANQDKDRNKAEGKSGANPERWSVAITQYVEGEEDTRESQSFSVKVLEDKSPTVDLLAPEAESLTLNPSERLPLRYEAADDVAVERAVLMVTVGDRALPAIPLPVASAPAPLISETAELDIAKVCPGGGSLTFYVRVHDNLPKELGGPNFGDSKPPRKITVVAGAQSYGEQRRMADATSARDMLRKILEHLQAGRADSSQLRAALPQMQVLTPEAIQRADHLRQQTAAANALIDKLLDIVAAYSGGTLRQGLDELAGHVSAADDHAGQLRLTESQQLRAELAVKADQRIEQAIAVANRLLAELQKVEWILNNMLKVQTLAGRQQTLADQMSQQPGDAALREAEGQIAREVGQLVETNTGAQAGQFRKHESRIADIVGKLRALEQHENQMAQQVGQLARQAPNTQPQMPAAMSRAEAERLGKEQQALAGEAAALARQAPNESAAQQAAKQAAQSAEQARQINPQNPSSASPAAQSAQAAAGKMQQLAQGMKAQAAGQQQGGQGKQGGQGQQGGQPGGGGSPDSPASQAEQLAQRQASLADQLEAYAGNRAIDLMEHRNKPVRWDTLVLKEEMEAMYRESYYLAGGISAGAREQLQRAISGQFVAAQKRANPLAADLRELAAMHDKAAQGAAKAVGHLNDPHARLSGRVNSYPSTPEGQQLSDSYDAAQSAAASGQPSPAAKAAGLLRGIAEGGMGRVAGLGLMPGQPGPSRGGPRGTGPQRVRLSGIQLRGIGNTHMNWERLPSELRNDILQGMAENAPQEYQVLIKRYFEALALRGGLQLPEERK
ncbi:MAG TPA: hypothetical protein VM098_04690 [Phycisphaerae bacterium]|nr:hypothetical protein [Phycisphaerae bacterium]